MRMERSGQSRFEGDFGIDLRGFVNGFDVLSQREFLGYF